MCKNRSYLFRLIASVFILILAFVSVVPSSLAAPLSSYYDWGPYYNSIKGRQVLGATFSSLEKLPVPNIPQEAIPPKAQGILPGNPLYNFELFAENIQLTFTFNPVQKETLRLAFASERLSEVKTLVDNNRPDLANNAASAYKNTMNAVSENLEKLASQKTPESENLLAKVENATASHDAFAQSLALSSGPDTTNLWNKILTAAEKAMDKAADAQNQPALPEELSTGIQTLRDQGLITPEESNKIYSLQSRTEVRNELDKLVASGQFPHAEVIKLNQIVSSKYPETYTQTQEVLKFAEIRTYQTLTPPSDEDLSKINEWRETRSEGVPPPSEIRPYLYYARAEELAKDIDFSHFEPEQQSEIARIYPDSVVQNPTFSGTPPSPTPSPLPSPTTTPEATAAETEGTISPSPSPEVSPSPTPSEPSIGPYLAGYKGPLPGTFGYFFKNIGEQVALAATFNSASRLELEMKYANGRLSEVHLLSKEEGKEKLYKEALERYQKAIDKVSNNIKNFNGPEEDKRDLAQALEAESARHSAVFEKGFILPPSSSEDLKIYTEAFNATEDAMDTTSDVLGRPALPQALANRLQDLKAQGTILPEEVSDLTNASSRAEVREKIRNLIELGSFPPADAKKLDEAQNYAVPSDFNQLTEIRKIEELQNLRAVQAEFAQTATLKETGASYEQRVNTLYNTIDPALISIEDLAGRDELIKTYKDIAAKAPKRPINAGQFGPDVIPGAPLPKPPAKSDAVFETCPIGALLNQFEGCVWEDTGKRINDYPQYKCERPAQYWSFVSNTCVPMDLESPGPQDSAPSCPIGYTWNWNASSCRKFTGGGSILPSPQPEPSPSEERIDELSKKCPEGSSYKVPRGCVWDKTDRPVYEERQYKCTGNNSYYSFTQNKCVPNPDPKKPFPDDAKPDCKEENTYWNWVEGKCVDQPKPVENTPRAIEFLTPKPVFTTPDSPFYFLKKTGEAVQALTAFGPKAREELKLSHARERFAEAYALLEKKNDKGFRDSLAQYTQTMQSVFNDIDKGLSLKEDDKKELGEKLAAEVANQNLLLQKVSILASDDVATPINAATSVVTQGIDRASDLQGQPAIPPEIKEKLDSLPENMLSEKQKQKLAEADTRLEARLLAGELAATGILTSSDIVPLDTWTTPANSGSILRLNEIKKLDEAVKLTNLKEDIDEKVEKTEDIAKKLDEFKKTFAPGEDIPADIRPYMRLTRIDEISQTIRPDVVRLEDFGNRKDLQLAVATLQQEFRPTKEDFQRLAEFRRSSPGRSLPPELARIEALSYSIGVRDNATACFLPSPPFAPNTPCPSSGAAIPIFSYYSDNLSFPGIGGFGGERLIVDGDGFKGWRSGSSVSPSIDKDGKPLVYGKGPEAAKPGVCPDGYHWMYDNGGWCMSNSGNYSFSSDPSSYQSPYPSSPGYTPYSPYYSAPGAPPQGYPGGYAAPYYYGSAPTSYNTAPASGTVPGTGPAPTAPGQCPSGFHWMPPSAGQAGWCMADGGTYTGGGYGGNASYGYTDYSATPTSGGYNCGSQPWDPVRQRCADGACPGGYSWDGSKCVPFTSPSYPGYPGGTSSYNTYYGGSGTTPGNYCQGLSCGGGTYLDYSTCSCKYPTSGSSTGSYTTGGSSYTGSCNPPAGGCGSGWFDYASCSCRAASSQGCYNVSASSCGSGFYWDSAACTCRSSGSTSTSGTGAGGSTGSCPSGSHWMSDNGGYCMSDTTTSNTSSGGSSSTSSGSCSSGYHWMPDNGGWCMSDGAASSGSTSTSTSTSTPTTTTTTEPAPAPSTSTTTSSPPPSSSEPVPPPPNP